MAKALIPCAQLQLDFPDVETRVMPKWGMWTFNTKRPGQPMTQKAYRLDQMEYVLTHLNPNIDSYMSQAFFAKPNRRAMNVAYMTHTFVDLDIYNVPSFAGLTHEQIAGQILMFCDDNGIPEPSVIISSGQGLYAKWHWSAPVARRAVGRVGAVTKAMVKAFQPFGADPKCVDVSRILRIVNTVNTKNGAMVRLLHVANRNGAPLQYDFSPFADEVLPYTWEQIDAFRKAAAARAAERALQALEETTGTANSEAHNNRRRFCREEWHWGVLEDLRTLMELRGWTVVPEGLRDLWGHLGACQLAMVFPYGSLVHEIAEWAGMILPAEYRQQDLMRHASSLLGRAKQAAAGDKVEFGGLKWTPIYTYSKETLINVLQVEPHEMPHMTCLIDTNEKYRRSNEKRRKTGLSREEYEAAASLKAQKAQALREQGMTWAQVAEAVGVPSGDAARKLIKRRSG